MPAVEIQFRGVLQAQHDRLSGHSLPGLPPVRFQNRTLLDPVVVEEAVHRHRPAPAPTSLRHASRRPGHQSFHQCPRSPIQARVPKVEVSKFGFRPAQCFQGQGVHAKSESDATRRKFTSPRRFHCR